VIKNPPVTDKSVNLKELHIPTVVMDGTQGNLYGDLDSRWDQQAKPAIKLYNKYQIR